MQQSTITSDSTTLKIAGSGSIIEGLVGAGAAALAILALGGILPQLFLIIATIAIGAALMLQGGAIASRFSKILAASSDRNLDMTELGSGLTIEVLGGLTGVTLGILALLDIFPLTLVTISIIVFGVTLIFGSSIMARLNNMTIDIVQEKGAIRNMAREAVNATSSVQLLIGLGAITLGILSLIGINSLTLNLVAILAIGISDLLSGTALGGRLMSVLKR